MLKDHRDLLLAFNACRVRFLLVGGHALGRYTEPRVTGDMDLFIDTSEENAKRVFAGLAQYGAPLAEYTVETFQDPYSGFQIGAPPQQIDLLFTASGLTFDEAWTNSVEGMTSDGIPVRYLSADDFIRNKIAAGRLQDQADVAAVIAARKANEKK
jgi:hypothetical protein